MSLVNTKNEIIDHVKLLVNRLRPLMNQTVPKRYWPSELWESELGGLGVEKGWVGGGWRGLGGVRKINRFMLLIN